MVKISCGRSNRPQKCKNCTKKLKCSYLLGDLSDSPSAKVGRKQQPSTVRKKKQNVKKMIRSGRKKMIHQNLAQSPEVNSVELVKQSSTIQKCSKAGRIESDMCNTCKHPKWKKKCLYQTGEMVAPSMTEAKISGVPMTKRKSFPPERLEPENFWKRKLPRVVKTSETTLLDSGVDLEQVFIKVLHKAYNQSLEILDLECEIQTLQQERDNERRKYLELRREVNKERRQTILQDRESIEVPEIDLASTEGLTNTVDANYVSYKPRSLRNHVKCIIDNIESITKNNPVKQICLVQELYKKILGSTEIPSSLKCQELALASLRSFFETLKTKYNGRYPNDIRQAQQIVCSAIASNYPQRKLGQLALATGATTKQLSKAQKRWKDWCDGTAEIFYDKRGQERSDKLPDEWLELATDVWMDLTRPSEKAKDSLKHPKKRKDETMYRIRWQECLTSEVHDEIMLRGKERFGEDFHFSMWYVLKCRPFFVKPAGRDVCLCVYCLRFALQVEALHQHYKTCRAMGCACTFALPPKNPYEFRSFFICQKDADSDQYPSRCLQNSCPTCKDWKLVPKCNCFQNPPTLKWERYEHVPHQNKHGEDVSKQDFVKVTTTFDEFWGHMKGYRKEYLQHFNKSQWQKAQFEYLEKNLPLRTTLVVPDYSENFHIERKRQHQSDYYFEKGCTLYPVVFLFRVEDLQVGKFFGGDEAEKQKLLDLFNKEWKALPVVKVSVIIISPDLKHDNAMVQHIHDKVLIPWLKQHVVNPETFTAQLVFSDGGPAHYKLSDHVFWISTQKSKHDIHVRWNFMAPGHGKNWSDPEGGSCKKFGQKHQLRSASGLTQQIYDAHDFYELLKQRKTEPKKTIIEKKGRGIMKRFFFFVPVTGEESANRRIPKSKTFEGIRKLFSIDDIGERGSVCVRTGSCYSCDSCINQASHNCANRSIDKAGQLKERDVEIKSIPRVPQTRGQLIALKSDIAQEATLGTFIAVELPGSEFAFTLCMIAAAGVVMHSRVRSVQVRFLEPISAGSTIHWLCDAVNFVPVENIVPVKNLHLARQPEARVTRRSHQNRLKYKLEADESERIYRNLGLHHEVVI